MTVAHMLFSFIVLAPFMMMEPFKSQHKTTLQKQWKGLLCIGAFMALNIALNNLSLVEITLSLNQVIRCFAAALLLICRFTGLAEESLYAMMRRQGCPFMVSKTQVRQLYHCKADQHRILVVVTGSFTL